MTIMDDILWPAHNCGMNLRLHIRSSDDRFVTEMRDRILQALETQESIPPAPEQDCLVLKDEPGVLRDLQEAPPQTIAPVVLLVGNHVKAANFLPCVASLPENCDPCVLAWMLDHLSANAWQWSGREERRREQRFSFPRDLAQHLRLVDISAGGCQLESTELFAVGRILPVPLNILQSGMELQLRVVRARSMDRTCVFRAHGYFVNFSSAPREALHDLLRSQVFGQ